MLDVAAHILSTGATVRACARRFGVSKTTVHKDMRERLPRLNATLADAVGRVLAFNKDDRHIRGGDATRRKYLMQRLARTRENQKSHAEARRKEEDGQTQKDFS